MSRRGISSLTLRKLRRLAQRSAWRSEEADDLVQDALLAAIEQRLDWDQDWDSGSGERRFHAWASGVIKRRALFLARTAGRRRRRELSYAVETTSHPTRYARLPLEFVDSLPRSLQTIALMANAGLGRVEIGYLLGISEVALRKRISDLRKAWRASSAEADLSSLPRMQHRPPCGLSRRSLRSALLSLPAARFAVVDPDGHKIFLAPTHKIPTHGNRR
jgi:DNA-directed RNA polymerase specialized sigma24 family protein